MQVSSVPRPAIRISAEIPPTRFCFRILNMQPTLDPAPSATNRHLSKSKAVIWHQSGYGLLFLNIHGAIV